MIHIKKMGKVRKYRVTCKRCGTVFTCEEMDVLMGPEGVIVFCPLCDKIVKVRESDEIKKVTKSRRKNNNDNQRND